MRGDCVCQPLSPVSLLSISCLSPLHLLPFPSRVPSGLLTQSSLSFLGLFQISYLTRQFPRHQNFFFLLPLSSLFASSFLSSLNHHLLVFFLFPLYLTIFCSLSFSSCLFFSPLSPPSSVSNCSYLSFHLYLIPISSLSSLCLLSMSS